MVKKINNKMTVMGWGKLQKWAAVIVAFCVFGIIGRFGIWVFNGIASAYSNTIKIENNVTHIIALGEHIKNIQKETGDNIKDLQKTSNQIEKDVAVNKKILEKLDIKFDKY
jgi:predicted PurR-regulated permease PerM